MYNTRIPGYGRKRPQLDKSIELLFLDRENPRLSEETQGKSDFEILNVLSKEFNLEELAESMAKNGYFDEEPLIAIPRKLPYDLKNVDPYSEDFLKFIQLERTNFTVVEGNRRLATAKILLDRNLREKLRIRHWPDISEHVAADLKLLPLIIYQNRNEVLPYLGVRHIVGIQKWDSYAKARYIAKMIGDGFSVKEVEAQIGDKQGAVIRYYVCYKLIEQLQDEFDFDTKKAKKDFSLLLLAVGQGNIKRFLGLPKKLSEINIDEPVPKGNLENLNNLVSWIFGHGKIRPVIRESRDITNYLSHIVDSPDAIIYLQNTQNLEGAYERSDGEEAMLRKAIAIANSKLETALGIVHRHKTPEVFLSSIWRELEYRQQLYSKVYFKVDDRIVEPHTEIKPSSEYLACLLLSLFGVQDNSKIQTKLFERITGEAIKCYLSGKAVVFGWPFTRGNNTEKNGESLISIKIRKLAKKLDERFCEAPAARFKDRGMDVVGWIPFSEKRSGKVVILLQCSAGLNWKNKLPVPIEAWSQYIHWACNPLIAYAVPCVVNERDWHDISKDKGIIFDRIRILNLLSDGIKDNELNKDLNSWVDRQLSDLSS